MKSFFNNRAMLFLCLVLVGASFAWKEPVPPDSLFAYAGSVCLNARVSLIEKYYNPDKGSLLGTTFRYCKAMDAPCSDVLYTILHLEGARAYDCSLGYQIPFPETFDSSRVLAADSIPISVGDTLLLSNYDTYWDYTGYYFSVSGTYKVNGVTYTSPIRRRQIAVRQMPFVLQYDMLGRILGSGTNSGEASR